MTGFQRDLLYVIADRVTNGIAIDHLHGEWPIPVGDMAVVQAYVYDAGTTSVQVRFDAFRENPHRRARGDDRTDR